MGASCGGGSDAPVVATVTAAPAEAEAAPTAPTSPTQTLRIALRSDPVWEWIKGSGRLATWQAQNNIRVEAVHPFNPWVPFADGAADLVVLYSLEVPEFIRISGRDLQIVGKVNTDRSVLAAGRTSRRAPMD